MPYEDCDENDWEQPLIVAGVGDYKDDPPDGPVRDDPDAWKFLNAFDPDEVEMVPEVDLLPDDALLEMLLQLPPHEPSAISMPTGPTAAARELHELSHANYEPWCRECVAGKSGEDRHSRKAKDSEPDRKRVDFDFQFFSREGQKVERESALATCCNMKDTTSGAPLLLYLPEKSTSAYAVRSMCVWLKSLGYAKILLQHDPENACKSLAARIQNELGPEMIQLRESPPFSRQSLGAGEGSDSQMAGMIRCWLAALQKR